MKTLLSLIVILVSTVRLHSQPNVGSSINLQVSNVCDNLGQLIGISNAGGAGSAAAFGNGGCIYNSTYTHYDSVQVGGPITMMNTDPSNFWPSQPKPLCIGNSNMVITYYNTFPTWGCNATTSPGDTLLLDSIAECLPYNGYLYVIRRTSQTPNFLIFQAPSSVPVFTATLNITPQKMGLAYQNAVIVGTGPSNEIRLNIFNLQFGIVTKDTSMGPLASNPKSLISGGSTFSIISSPGDTAVILTSYNINTQLLTTIIINPTSGLNTGTFYHEFYDYQLLTDTTGNNFDLKVRRFSFLTMQHSATFNIGKRLRILMHASSGSGAYYPFLHAVTDSIPMCGVWVYDGFNYSLADSFTTPAPPDFILTDFRCPTSVEEYDDHLVQLKVYPNPTDGMINIKASGLICGRDYTMDIIDINGKIHFEQSIHAKMNLEIPIGHLPSGIYFLRIHTLKGVVTERIVRS